MAKLLDMERLKDLRDVIRDGTNGGDHHLFLSRNEVKKLLALLGAVVDAPRADNGGGAVVSLNIRRRSQLPPPKEPA